MLSPSDRLSLHKTTLHSSRAGAPNLLGLLALVDSTPVHPYLGLAAMGAFVTRAGAAVSCLLVVTRSSNPEGRRVQSALDASVPGASRSLLRDGPEVSRFRDAAAMPASDFRVALAVAQRPPVSSAPAIVR